MIKKPILKLFLSNFKVGKQTFNFTKWLFSQKLVDFSFFGNYILLSKISSYLETYLFNTLAADTRFEYRSIIIVKMSLWFRPPKMMTWFLINDTYWENIHHLKGGYWKYSPRVVNISPREAKPWEVIYDHKRWIFPISTFQMVDIHIIHNFIPPCSLLKWKSMFSKSANISLHKSNIRHLKKKVRIFHYINPISVIWNDGYWIYVVKISVIWNCTFFLLYHIFQQ